MSSSRLHTKRVRVQLDCTFEFESDEIATDAMGWNWAHVLLHGVDALGRELGNVGDVIELLPGARINVRLPQRKKDE